MITVRRARQSVDIDLTDPPMHFDSKTDFHAAERAVRQKAKIGTPLIGSALAIAGYALVCHPRARELASDMTAIIVEDNLEYGRSNLTYAVVKEDGTRDLFSKNYCLMPPEKREEHHTASTRERAMQAARRAIQPEIVDAKAKLMQADPHCARCHAAVRSFTANLHHREFKFRDIYDTFFSTPPAIVRADNGIRDFADPDVVTAWQVFHQRAADYDLLCDDCHYNEECGENHRSRDTERRAAP